jgi:hydrophobic/amphiphilic exporter-1 (mainly G- bacteria), HAE1 family
VPSFFIDRPVFAWIIAIAIMIAGALAIPQLPVSQFPRLAPPRVYINASYPGASAETVDSSVASIIEESLDGSDGLQYYETSSDAQGNLQIEVTFSTDTSPDLAVIDVQNRMKQIEARLPQVVVQQGISVQKASGTFLMIVSLTSTDGTRDPAQLSDYLSRYLVRDIKRIPGVGSVEQWDAGPAMRIWVDPMKLREFNLTQMDVTNAIGAQNAAVAAGAIGDAPYVVGQKMTASVVVKGQLVSPDEFGMIVLKSQLDGSVVRLRDVARIELGRDDYSSTTRLNGKESASLGVKLAPRGNALETAQAVHARIAELQATLPPGVVCSVPFDTSTFVHLSISEVVKTLIEAIVLVFFVMWLFLQDLRYTLIPTVVIPVALMGAFLTMYALGFSINTFTLFGLVLAIGILVDDAIVVVENVDRVMHEEGLSPRDATRKAMSQISGAIVGVTVVLTSVFVPMAFFPGGVGGIYRQFAIAMIASMLFSALMALSLTPALCANLLRVPSAGEMERRRTSLSGRFLAGFERLSGGYRSVISKSLRRSGMMLLLYAGLILLCGALYAFLPGGFLPIEDQGSLQVTLQLPAGATQERTMVVLKQVENALHLQPAVDKVISVVGWSFSGNGPNAGMAFVELKPWEQRTDDASTVREKLNASFSKLLNGEVMAVQPPAVPGFGDSAGFVMRLEDRGGIGMTALTEARQKLLSLAKASPVLQDVHSDSMPDAPRLTLDIDRAKAYSMGLTFDNIDATLSTALGMDYVNDFPNGGRMQRVLVEADATSRMQPDDMLQLTVRNAAGAMVPLSSFSSLSWGTGPVALMRYNGYPALDISGHESKGYSSGAALAEMERLVGQLPVGIGYEWTGQAFEEGRAARQTPMLIGLSLLAVFMALAALYESWTIPLSVLLVVPLGILGAVGAVLLRGMPNDIYFKVGMVTVVGLSGKNAILITQFARELYARGMPLNRAVAEAAATRFRPIVMTSAAFMLGVMPLVLSTGAGAESRHSIGTGVLGGILTATVLGMLFAPMLFKVVVLTTGNGRKHPAAELHPAVLPVPGDEPGMERRAGK